MQTVYGGLFTSLHLQAGDRLLIRGGTTSIGLAASAVAKYHGAFVTSTTRDVGKADLLRNYGADQVLIDTDNSIASLIPESEKFTKVLELVGIPTMIDSLKCIKTGGTLCILGYVGDIFAFEQFSPSLSIPTAVNLTTYSSSTQALLATPLDKIIGLVAEGKLKVPVGKVFQGLEQIVEAHRLMDSNQAGGKIVVLVD